MGKLRQMYMDTFVDKKKVEESAYKVANDRYDPSPVLIHYHKYSETCSLEASHNPGPPATDNNHKMVQKEEAKDD